MPYVLTLATPEGRDLVVGALRSAADQRTRVARTAAGKVAADKRGGTDVRSSAVKVTLLLAEADQLAGIADELAALAEVPLLTPAPPVAERHDAAIAAAHAAAAADPDVVVAIAPVEDDGLSEAAHRAAALAGLDDALVDPDGDDVDTGATAEDDPTTPEEVLP